MERTIKDFRKYRKVRGVKTVEVADEYGCHISYISNLEKEVRGVSEEVLDRLFYIVDLVNSRKKIERAKEEIKRYEETRLMLKTELTNTNRILRVAVGRLNKFEKEHSELMKISAKYLKTSN